MYQQNIHVHALDPLKLNESRLRIASKFSHEMGSNLKTFSLCSHSHCYALCIKSKKELFFSGMPFPTFTRKTRKLSSRSCNKVVFWNLHAYGQKFRSVNCRSWNVILSRLSVNNISPRIQIESLCSLVI